jgi:WD40 repeat protein
MMSMYSSKRLIVVVVCSVWVLLHSFVIPLNAQEVGAQISLGRFVAIDEVLWHPDGETLAVSAGETVILFQDLVEVARLPTQVGNVTDIDWNEDGSVLAVAGDSSPRIELWGYDSVNAEYSLVSDFTSDQVERGGISAIAWSPDNSQLAVQIALEPIDYYVGARASFIEIWNASNGVVELTVQTGTQLNYVDFPASFVDWTTNGQYIIFGSFMCDIPDEQCPTSPQLFLADVATGSTEEFDSPIWAAKSLDINDTGALAIGSTEVSIYDEQGQLLYEWNADGIEDDLVFTYVAWQPLGSLLMAVSYNLLTVWDFETQNVLLTTPTIFNVHTVDWSSRDQLALGTQDGIVYAVDVDDLLNSVTTPTP